MTAADLADATAPARRREWRPGRPVDVAATWGTLRRGAGDPAWHSDGRAVWRGISTAQGPLTLRVAGQRGDARVVAHAWGSVAAVETVLDRLPRMLGADDDVTGFVPRHPVLEQAMRRRPGWRVPCTGLVLESLVPAVIEQKVTGQEAFGGWRRLVRRHGTPAPGPGAALGLRVPPDVPRLRALPSWEWLKMGISPQRADTLMRVLEVATRMEELPSLEAAAARRRLMSVRGVGVWTAAETAQRALGDPDAVSFGDYHVAKNIGWALTGREVDDTGLADLLAPWTGHRYRVQRLLELTGAFRPRRGPRMAPRRHLPLG
ncbi:MAG: DNA-3-methyladenine glycosylase family protein [Ornithinimicrobium sp.]|uniref:DNA-3-methyladenine glycosylase family protein n=1 Tax=Ornithinimicrobium sp. TaxID=1977084 RepID=UPI003D9B9046